MNLCGKSTPFLLATIVALLLSSGTSANGQTCGDVNGTNTVTTSDALSVLRVAVGQDLDLSCSGNCETVEPRLTTLEATLVEKSNELAELADQLAAAKLAIGSLQDLFAGVDREAETLTFTGINLQIVDGSGDTAGTVNGLGNLIIGYNESTSEPARTGSHNLVIGTDHGYSSFGGLVTGARNVISNAGAACLGGSDNVASASYSTVCGGKENTASGLNATVGAGFGNVASGQYASVSGGCENQATNTFAAVSGGQAALASGEFSSVSGGLGNSATSSHSTTSGGKSRSADGLFDWRAGALFEEQ